MTSVGGTSAGEAAPPGPRSVLLIEDQPDHAELMLEALGTALPGVHVCWPPHHACDEGPPDVVVISLATDPLVARRQANGALRESPRPPVIVVDGPGVRWTAADLAALRPQARLDKRGGAAFLRRLPRAIAELHTAARVPAPAGDAAASARFAPPPDARAAAPTAPRGTPVPPPAPSPAPAPPAAPSANAPAAPPAAPATAPSAATPATPSAAIPAPPTAASPAARPMAFGAVAGTAAAARAAHAPTATRPPQPPPSPARAPRPASGNGSRPAPTNGGAPRPGPDLGDRAPADGSDQRCTEMVAGLLSDTLDGLLANLGPLTELVRARCAEDKAVARYVASLDDEIARARAVARRIGAIVRPEGPLVPRRLQAGPFVGLRVHAWEMLAPAGVDVLFSATDDSPRLEIHAEMLGKALDDLVAALLSRAPTPSRLRVEVGTALADEPFCAAREGLRPGRYARIVLAIDTGAAAEYVSAVPSSRRIERALAAVKAHEGYLELSDDAARGALGRAELLLAPVAPRRVQIPSGPPSVLLVDDEDGVRRVGAEMLRADGFVVADAPSGEDAVALYLAGCRYDLVLLDLAMSGMSGYSTFRAIRGVDPHAAAILVSGSVSATTLRTLLDEGLLGFLPKPFNMRQLLEAARAGLGRI